MKAVEQPSAKQLEAAEFVISGWACRADPTWFAVDKLVDDNARPDMRLVRKAVATAQRLAPEMNETDTLALRLSFDIMQRQHKVMTVGAERFGR